MKKGFALPVFGMGYPLIEAIYNITYLREALLCVASFGSETSIICQIWPLGGARQQKFFTRDMQRVKKEIL